MIRFLKHLCYNINVYKGVDFMFSDILKELRIKNKLSQEKLANELNIRKSTISNWEMNKSKPSFDMLKKISEYFGVSIDYLLGQELDTINRLRVALTEANVRDVDEVLKIIEILQEKNKDVHN